MTIRTATKRYLTVQSLDHRCMMAGDLEFAKPALEPVTTLKSVSAEVSTDVKEVHTDVNDIVPGIDAGLAENDWVFDSKGRFAGDELDHPGDYLSDRNVGQDEDPDDFAYTDDEITPEMRAFQEGLAAVKDANGAARVGEREANLETDRQMREGALQRSLVNRAAEKGRYAAFKQSVENGGDGESDEPGDPTKYLPRDEETGGSGPVVEGPGGVTSGVGNPAGDLNGGKGGFVGDPAPMDEQDGGETPSHESLGQNNGGLVTTPTPDSGDEGDFKPHNYVDIVFQGFNGVINPVTGT